MVVVISGFRILLLAMAIATASMLVAPSWSADAQSTSVQSRQTQEKLPMHHAQGNFEVVMKPLPSAPAEGLGRMSIDKTIHGDLEGTSVGEMISAGNPKIGEAGYVAMEVITGKLGARSGSFVLQHNATMDASGYSLQIIVAPGSGAGDFKGIAGTFTVTIANGAHSYAFDYTLPAAD